MNKIYVFCVCIHSYKQQSTSNINGMQMAYFYAIVTRLKSFEHVSTWTCHSYHFFSRFISFTTVMDTTRVLCHESYLTIRVAVPVSYYAAIYG